MEISKKEFEKTERIRLVYSDPFHPFAYSKGVKSEGVVIDILDAALHEVNINAVYLPKNLDEVQDALHTGEADGIAVFAVTQERRKIFDYSASLIRTGAGLFIKRSEPQEIDLAGGARRKICTPTKGPLTDYISKRFPDVSLKGVPDYPAALEAVMMEKADGAALNIHVGARLANELFPGKFKIPARTFMQTPLAVAVLKGKNRYMLQRISVGLEKVKEKGIEAKILDKWFQQVD